MAGQGGGAIARRLRDDGARAFTAQRGQDAEFEGVPAAFRAHLSRIHPVGRTGKTEDAAALVALLASGESAFVAGRTFTIDGGRTVRPSLP